MNTIVRGSLAGILGTAFMSLVIAAGRAVGLLRNPPPRQITHNIESKARIRHKVPGSLFEASWLAAHLGYGAACGLLYSLIRPLLPRSPLIAGLLYGSAVWGTSYLGLMPKLGLYPDPKADSPFRQAVLVAAHGVFGVTTAEAEGLLQLRQ